MSNAYGGHNSIWRRTISFLLCLCYILTLGLSTAKYEQELPVDDVSVDVVADIVVTLKYMDGTTPDQEYIYEGSLPTPSKVGYTFLGWYYGVQSGSEWTYGEKLDGEPENHSVLLAGWTPRTDIRYKVYYQLEDLGADTYTTDITHTKTNGTTGKEITPVVRDYPGFTAPEPQTVTIAPDGSTEVYYKYKRNSYQFTLGSADGVSTNGSSESGSYEYEEEITLNASVSDGYTWVNWESSDTDLIDNIAKKAATFKMPAGNLTMTPTANMNEAVAFAIYSETGEYDEDGNEIISLTFYKNTDVVVEGGTYDNKPVTAIYTGFEDIEYDSATKVPWSENRTNITKVSFADKITPTSTARWFFSFDNCGDFDLTNLNTENVENFYSMFYRAGYNLSEFKLDVSPLNTAKVKDMTHVLSFTGYNADTWEITGLNDWDTSSLENAYSAFTHAGYSAKEWTLDLSGWKTSNLQNAEFMFDYTGYANAETWKLTGIENWDLQSLKTTKSMFYAAGYTYAEYELDLSGWETPVLENASTMFYSCRGLKRIYATDKFTASDAAENGSMFTGCDNLTGGAGTTYKEDNPHNGTYAHVDGGTDNPGYFSNNVLLSYNTVKQYETIEPDLAIISKIFNDYVSIKYSVLTGSEYASVDEATGVVTGKAEGTAIIQVTLTSKDGSTISAQASVDVDGYISVPTAYLYDDGSFVFTDGTYGSQDTTKTLVSSYTGWDTTQYEFDDEGNINRPWNDQIENITSIKIQDGITPQYTDWWFYGAINAKSLYIGNGITNIGMGTFAGCGLTGDLVIPDTVTTIGIGAFSGSSFTGNLTIGSGVTTIEYGAFSECAGFIGDLVIPDSVTTIGEYAFEECTGFNGNLIIGSKVETIGESAFYGCSGLTGNLTIGDNVTTIGYGAFQECSGLTGDLIIPNSVMTIEEQAFALCSGFNGRLVLPNSITAIKGAAFYGCSGLTGELIIPNSVTFIENRAFYNCEHFIGNLVIPNNVDTIESEAFYNCPNITEITFGNSVTKIGYHAFYVDNEVITVINGGNDVVKNYSWRGDNRQPDPIAYLYSDGSIVFTDGHPEKLDTTKTLVASYTGWDTAVYERDDEGNINRPWDDQIENITSITIQDGVNPRTTSFWFTGAINAKNLYIGDGVTDIGFRAFSGCSSLTGDLIIPDSVTTIQIEAFFNCPGLTGNLVIPDSVTFIGSMAFAACRGFGSELIIPDSVTTIGQYAFLSCSGITEITFSNEITEIDEDAFYVGSTTPTIINGGNDIVKNYDWDGDNRPKPVPTAYLYDDGSFVFTDGLPGSQDTSKTLTASYTGWDTAVYEQDDEWNINRPWNDQIENITSITIQDGITPQSTDFWFINAINAKSLYIGDGITNIGLATFAGCGFTGDLVIPDSVTTIGYAAFAECGYFTGDLVIPDSVTTIGDFAFQGCIGFTGDLVIPDNVTTIGYGAFQECTGFNGNLIIGSKVETIGEDAFFNCTGFTGNLTIGDNVTTIGYGAFQECSGLTGDLIIPNSVMTIEGEAFEKCTGFNGRLVLPNSITAINGFTFHGCSGLTGELIIPDSVTLIDNWAFYNCPNITEITLGNSVTEIGNHAFDVIEDYDVSLTSITVPGSITSYGSDWLTTPSGGYWYNAETGEAFTVAQIPTKTAATYVTVSPDKTSPVLTVTAPTGATATAPTTVTSSSVVVSGTVTDADSGIKSVTVNGVAAEIAANGSWSVTLGGLATDVTTEIIIEATDNANNTSTTFRYVVRKSSVTWRKYSCTANTGYTQDARPSGSGFGGWAIGYNFESINCFSGYSFSETQGYVGTGYKKLTITATTTEEEITNFLVGNYQITTTGNTKQVSRIDAIDEIGAISATGVKGVTVSSTRIVSATYSTTYTKGTTSYGTITAVKGELPESGTLMDGSATGNYCVLKRSSTYYYYEKVGTYALTNADTTENESAANNEPYISVENNGDQFILENGVIFVLSEETANKNILDNTELLTAETVDSTAVGLSLRNDIQLPVGVSSGVEIYITEMPDVTGTSVFAQTNAPRNTELVGWLVNSGMAQQIIEPNLLEDVLLSVYNEEANWPMTLTPLYKTTDPGAMLLAFAKQEIGIQESTTDYELTEEGEQKGYTKYGALYGLPYSDWCAMFIGWNMREANLVDLPCAPGCGTWVRQAKEAGLYYTSAEYVPGPGDAVFVDYNKNGAPDHVGIVVSLDLENGILKTIEGNYGNTVAEVTRAFDARILGYMAISLEGCMQQVLVPENTGISSTSITPLQAPIFQEIPDIENSEESTEPATETAEPDAAEAATEPVAAEPTVPENAETTISEPTTPAQAEAVIANAVESTTGEGEPQSSSPAETTEQAQSLSENVQNADNSLQNPQEQADAEESEANEIAPDEKENGTGGGSEAVEE